MMSHEIRTPMNGIIGLTNLLLQDNPRSDQMESLRLLRFSGENLLTIINDILDFSKIEAGKIELENIDLDLYELVNNIRQMMDIKAKDKGIRINLHFDRSIPTLLKADSVRLTQILTNLVGNAVKFTESGSVDIIVNLLKEKNSAYPRPRRKPPVNSEEQAWVFQSRKACSS
jgi:signal transduction histidine kinase